MRLLAGLILFAVTLSAQVLCSVCVKKGLKSTVRAGMTSVNAVYIDSYWDEDGVYQSGGSPDSITEFYCSRGHRWTESCDGGLFSRDCKMTITKDTEDEPITISGDGLLVGDKAVGRWDASWIADITDIKLYPDEGPHVAIHPDCSVGINRNSSLEQVLGELVKLIALHSRGPLCAGK